MKLKKIIFILALFSFCGCQSKIYQDKIYNFFHKNSTDNQKISQIYTPEFTESNQEQSKQYVFGTDEIPLFSGLKLVEEDSSSFDAMFGNIIISKYINIDNNIKIKDVREFYLTTLPQLGWKIINKKSDDIIYFDRDGDKLEIKFQTFQKTFFVKFFISSALQ